MMIRSQVARALGAACLLMVAATACAADSTDTSPPQRVPTTTAAEAGTTMPSRDDRTAAVPPEAVPADEGATIGAAVPDDLLEMVVSDAAVLAAVDGGEVRTLTAQAMTWSDGSLGCAAPGEIYTQEPVAGYWVVLEAGGVAYDYRVTDRGAFKLCTSPLPAPGDTTPTS